jgi:hypothetical protein
MQSIVFAEDRSKMPTPKPDTSWKDAWSVIQPLVAEEQKNVLKELEQIQAKERCVVVTPSACALTLLASCERCPLAHAAVSCSLWSHISRALQDCAGIWQRLRSDLTT